MTYELNDQVLSVLGKGLPDPCPVRIIVNDHDIRLYVGPRDWQWDVRTGQFIGSGTRLGSEMRLGHD